MSKTMGSERIVLPTCEVSMDPETAVELGVGWGVTHFELKTLWEDRRVPDITPKQRAYLRQLAGRYDARWLTLSPGLFIRSEARDDAADREVAAKVSPTIELAHELGCSYLVAFSFRRTEGTPEAWVVERLRSVAALARGSGLTIVVEPLAGTYCDSAEALGRVVRAVDDPTVRANWDPGNVAKAGFPAFPEGYRQVRDLVGYVHLKNYRRSDDQFALFDHGDIDLAAQIAALHADGYHGPYAIETHTRYNAGAAGLPPVAATRANCETLRRWLDTA